MGLLGFNELKPQVSDKWLPVANCNQCRIHRQVKGGQRWHTPGAACPPEAYTGVLVVHGYPVQSGYGQEWLPSPLLTMLDRVGMPPGYEIATALACPIADLKNQPTGEHAKACSGQLWDTIQRLQPHTIVAYSQLVAQSLLTRLWGDEAGLVRDWVGHQIPDQTLNAWVCPVTLGGVRERQVDEIHFYHHVRAAVERAQKAKRPWPQGVPDWAGQVERIYDPDQAAARIRSILASNPSAISFDYEATGLKPEAPGMDLVSCAIAWGHGPKVTGCIAYPWLGAVVDATREVLRSPVPKIGANTKFEERWSIAKLGTRVRNWYWCDMLAAHWAQPQDNTSSFKFQAYVHLGYPNWAKDIQPYLESSGPSIPNRIRDIPLPDLLRYNGLDAMLEYMVAYRQMAKAGYPLP